MNTCLAGFPSSWNFSLGFTIPHNVLSLFVLPTMFVDDVNALQNRAAWTASEFSSGSDVSSFQNGTCFLYNLSGCSLRGLSVSWVLAILDRCSVAWFFAPRRRVEQLHFCYTQEHGGCYFSALKILKALMLQSIEIPVACFLTIKFQVLPCYSEAHLYVYRPKVLRAKLYCIS